MGNHKSGFAFGKAVLIPQRLRNIAGLRRRILHRGLFVQAKRKMKIGCAEFICLCPCGICSRSRCLLPVRFTSNYKEHQPVGGCSAISKKRFSAGCQPRHPFGCLDVVGFYSPRRRLAISPRRGLDVLSGIVGLSILPCLSAVQLLRAAHTEP